MNAEITQQALGLLLGHDPVGEPNAAAASLERALFRGTQAGDGQPNPAPVLLSWLRRAQAVAKLEGRRTGSDLAESWAVLAGAAQGLSVLNRDHSTTLAPHLRQQASASNRFGVDSAALTAAVACTNGRESLTLSRLKTALRAHSITHANDTINLNGTSAQALEKSTNPAARLALYLMRMGAAGGSSSMQSAHRLLELGAQRLAETQATPTAQADLSRSLIGGLMVRVQGGAQELLQSASGSMETALKTQITPLSISLLTWVNHVRTDPEMGQDPAVAALHTACRRETPTGVHQVRLTASPPGTDPEAALRQDGPAHGPAASASRGDVSIAGPIPGKGASPTPLPFRRPAAREGDRRS